jgi:outer membrane immunogenic protein
VRSDHFFGCCSGGGYAVKAPPPVVAAPAYNWSGWYAGVEGGGGFGSSNQIAGGPLGFGPITAGYRLSGWLAGGTVGYNYQSGAWVFGLEGDMSWAKIRGSGNEVSPFTPTVINQTNENWLDTARGRIGYSSQDGWLIYATGGVAVAGVQAATVAPPGLASLSETQTRWGGVVGGGAEVMIAPAWSVKAEYLYTSMQSKIYFAAPPAGVNTRSNVPVEESIVRVGINYHFSTR